MNNHIDQVDKIYRHNRQGSYKTKERYYEAMERFCRFLAETYRLEKLANIGPKHIYAYVDYMKAKGLSASTIKTDLGAIRFYHDKLSEPRHKELPPNADLSLERRTFGKVDRAWSDTEFTKMISIAVQCGRPDYATVLHLARCVGLRGHECFRIDTAMARHAIKTMQLTIKGKGGKGRTVPITPAVRDLLHICLTNITPGDKLFVPNDIPTHVAVKRLQAFIRIHREQVMGVDTVVPVTLHGLRHSFAVEQYQQYMQRGFSDEAAKYFVSKLLGHNRPEVTNIFLASLKGGDGDA